MYATSSKRALVHAKSGSLEWCIRNFLLDARARDLSEETLDFYARKLRPLEAYLPTVGVTRAAHLTGRHLSGYMVQLRSLGLSPSNLASYGRALKALVRWMVAQDMASADVLRGFKIPKPATVVRDGFSAEEVGALIHAAARTALPDRNAAVVCLMADTGLRAGEVGRIADEDYEQDRIHIHGKGMKERFVPIAPATRKAIERYRRKRGEADWLFITVRDEAFTRQTVYKLFRRLGELTGISPCHPHMMRRATAREWIRSGGDTFSLQGLLGHSSQTMTKVYVELASEDVAKKHRVLSLVESIKRKGR